jgi:hypothetical protein
MVAAEPKNRTDLAKLRYTYDTAFATWVKEVAYLRACVADPTATETTVEHARRQSARAQAVYRECRDRLWQHMNL